MKLKKSKLIFVLSLLLVMTFALPVVAEVVQVDAGLNSVDQNALANTVKNILMKIGYFIGIAAVGALIFSAYRMTIGNEKQREEAKTHVLWSLGAVVLVAMSIMVVGFVANLVK